MGNKNSSPEVIITSPLLRKPSIVTPVKSVKIVLPVERGEEEHLIIPELTEEQKLEEEARKLFNKAVGKAREKNKEEEKKRQFVAKAQLRKVSRNNDLRTAFADRVDELKRGDEIRKRLARMIREEKPTDTRIDNIVFIERQYRDYDEMINLNLHAKSECQHYIDYGNKKPTPHGMGYRIMGDVPHHIMRCLSAICFQRAPKEMEGTPASAPSEIEGEQS